MTELENLKNSLKYEQEKTNGPSSSSTVAPVCLSYDRSEDKLKHDVTFKNLYEKLKQDKKENNELKEVTQKLCSKLKKRNPGQEN